MVPRRTFIVYCFLRFILYQPPAVIVHSRRRFVDARAQEMCQARVQIRSFAVTFYRLLIRYSIPHQII